MRRRLALLVLTLQLAATVPAAGFAAQTAADTAAVCDSAAALAARQSGVPLAVLRAIALAETGRRADGAFRPWPWTVNMEGEGLWFATRREALDYVLQQYQRGARSFDVGCFQINFKWHGDHFASIEQMFDPVANATYAARYLGELQAETADWVKTAGAYHSRTPEFASRYAARFETILANLTGQGGVAPSQADGPEIPEISEFMLAALTAGPLPAALRPNRYPLLQAGGTGGLGSLVPREQGPGTGLLAANARALVP